VTKGSAIISHLDDPPTRLNVDAVVIGPVNTALAMVNGKPLDLVDPSIIAAADIGGTATTEVKVVLPLDGPSSGEVETFDVRSTLKTFSWSKAPLGLKATEGDLLLHVNAKGLEVGGSSKFNGVPAKITFDEFFSGGEVLRSVKGASFDIAPLITSLESESKTDRPASAKSASATPPLDIEVRLEHVYGERGVQFTSVTADASFDGQAWERATVEASTTPEGRVSLALGPGADGYSLHLGVDNLGQVVDSFGLTAEFEGGTLDLTAESPSETGAFKGQIVIRHTTLIQSNLMTQLLRLTSLQGLLASFTSSGFNINRVTSDLRYENNRLAISNMRVHADGLGIVVNGTIDFGADEIDISGALAPSGTIQHLIGHIPLLGRVLTGVNREGIVAALFTLKGKLAEPEIKTQPLSMLTPGISRDLAKLLPDADEATTTSHD